MSLSSPLILLFFFPSVPFAELCWRVYQCYHPTLLFSLAVCVMFLPFESSFYSLLIVFFSFFMESYSCFLVTTSSPFEDNKLWQFSLS